jgi:peptide/nickel transport system substrate-binding protein
MRRIGLPVLALMLGLAAVPVEASAGLVTVHLATASASVPWDLTSWDPGMMNFERLLCDGLYDYADTTGQLITPVPAIAAGEPATTPNASTFTIRPGLRFSDGTPVTSADVKGSLLRMLDANARVNDLYPWYPYYYDVIPGAMSFFYDGVTHPAISTPDATHVTINVAWQDAAFAHALAWAPACVVPATATHGHTNLPPASTGPYMVTSHTSTEVVLGRNLNWYGADGNATVMGRAGELATSWQPDQFVIETGIAPAVQLSRIRAGTLDGSVDYSESDPGATDPAFVGHSVRSRDGAVNVIELNTVGPGTKARQLRRAIAYALDRTKLARLAGPTAVAVSNLLAPAIDASRPFALRPNLKKARAALRAAKLKKLPKLVFMTGGIAYEKAVIKEVKAELRKVGLTVVARPYSSLPPNPKSWSMSLYGWAADFPDASEVLRQMLSTGGPDDDTGYGGLDAALKAIAAMPLGPAREKKATALATKTLLNDAPLVPFATIPNVHLWSTHLGNVVYVPTMGIRWSLIRVLP